MIRSDYISGRQRAETNTRKGGRAGRGDGMFPLMHPTDDKTPSCIHLSVMAVLWSDVERVWGELTPLTDGRQRLSGQTLSRDDKP